MLRTLTEIIVYKDKIKIQPLEGTPLLRDFLNIEITQPLIVLTPDNIVYILSEKDINLLTGMYSTYHVLFTKEELIDIWIKTHVKYTRKLYLQKEFLKFIETGIKNKINKGGYINDNI